MKISRQARQEAKQLLQGCGGGGRLDEGRVRQVVAEVIARRPRGYLAILEHFQRRLRLEVERRRARVVSAVALEAGDEAAVRASLERLYGPGLAVELNVEAGLVGGMRVQVGSDVYDGSVRARLARLGEQF